MTVEVFTKGYFEAVLHEACEKVGLEYRTLGLDQGEYTYLIPVQSFENGQGVAIQVRSSVNSAGVSATAGEDSIRCWVVNQDGNSLGSKVGRWITRQEGWEFRLDEKIATLVGLARKIRQCPGCKDLMSVFVVKKEGKNKGRFFMKCRLHGHFTWLDEFEETDEIVPAVDVKSLPRAVRENAGFPPCPKCGKLMVTRQRRSDNAQFWGCQQFPKCTGTRPYYQTASWVREDEAVAGTAPKKFEPSQFQKAIFEFVRNGEAGNAMVEAVAGSGKTTTIVMALGYTDPGSKVAFMAFNRHIAKELRKRAPRHVDTLTTHSHGFSACRSHIEGMTVEAVDEKKVDKILQRCLDPFTMRHLYPVVKTLVALAKANLIDYEDEAQVDWIVDRYGIELNGDRNTIYQALVFTMGCCEKELGTIDYDDMIWLPVRLGFSTRKYDFIFVDEAQDLNKAQIELILMSLTEGGRIIAVGDRYQSLYGFRGADVDAIPNIIEATGASSLPLSITYRCPKSHVRLAQEIGPGYDIIQAAEWADEGIVRDLPDSRLETDVKFGDLVLCRTNAPLVGPAFALIRAGVKAVIMGRDIGSGLITLVRKIGETDIVEMLSKLREYKDREITKLMAAEKNSQAQTLEDKVETIVALCDGCRTVYELENRIETVFSDDAEGVVFSSVHRAKGLEADRVYILRPGLMPHPRASQEWELVQEHNIKYVAYTRSKSELIFVR